MMFYYFYSLNLGINSKKKLGYFRYQCGNTPNTCGNNKILYGIIQNIYRITPNTSKGLFQIKIKKYALQEFECLYFHSDISNIFDIFCTYIELLYIQRNSYYLLLRKKKDNLSRKDITSYFFSFLNI